MSTGIDGGTEGRQPPDLETALPSVMERVRELPGWFPWAVLAGTAVLVGAGTLALGGTIGLSLIHI